MNPTPNHYDCPHCGHPGATVTVEGNAWNPTLIVECTGDGTIAFSGKALERMVQRILRKSETPAETLAAPWLRRLSRGVSGVLVGIARHPNTPQGTLTKLAGSGNHWQARLAVMENANTRPDVRQELEAWAGEREKALETRRREARLARQVERARKAVQEKEQAWLSTLGFWQRQQVPGRQEPPPTPDFDTTLAAVQLYQQREHHERSWEDCWGFASRFRSADTATPWLYTGWTPEAAVCAHRMVGYDRACAILGDLGLSQVDVNNWHNRVPSGHDFPWTHWNAEARSVVEAISWCVSPECHQVCPPEDDVDRARLERKRSKAEREAKAAQRAVDDAAAQRLFDEAMSDL